MRWLLDGLFATSGEAFAWGALAGVALSRLLALLPRP